MASGESVRRAIREVRDQGYCVLRGHFPAPLVDACRHAFWPRLLAYLDSGLASNRGPRRHYLPMPFEPPCFTAQFFFDPAVLAIVRGLMDDRVVADQWGCDVTLRGSEYQAAHVDYQRPLFPEAPDLALPPYAVVVSFGLVRIAPEHGPVEIAPGTQRMTRPAPRSPRTETASVPQKPAQAGAGGQVSPPPPAAAAPPADRRPGRASRGGPEGGSAARAKDRVRRHRSGRGDRRPGTKAGLTRIGADKCRLCHKVQHASWAASAHAKRTPPLDCESCHGPGSEYKTITVMKDPAKAKAAGLVLPDAAFCQKCHKAPWDPALLAKAHAHKVAS